MLYVSTRNTTDTYTAYRALHEVNAPDGGSYVPFHLHTFSSAELLKMRENPCCNAIAEILNLFFGLRLSCFDVESVIGRTPFKVELLPQRLIVAETWRNPDSSSNYLVNNLYKLACGDVYSGSQPSGWSLIAIKIAVLFGIYTSTEIPFSEKFDIAVPADDFSDIVAICYCKAMGLPIGLTACACSDNSALWDFICRGELSTVMNPPAYMEMFIYKIFGTDEVRRYLEVSRQRRAYLINEAQQLSVTFNLSASVVSTRRIEAVISGMYQSNRYRLDRNAALSYSALQDYRARTGINKNTLILAKKRTN